MKLFFKRKKKPIKKSLYARLWKALQDGTYEKISDSVSIDKIFTEEERKQMMEEAIEYRNRMKYLSVPRSNKDESI